MDIDDKSYTLEIDSINTVYAAKLTRAENDDGAGSGENLFEEPVVSTENIEHLLMYGLLPELKKFQNISELEVILGKNITSNERRAVRNTLNTYKKAACIEGIKYRQNNKSEKEIRENLKYAVRNLFG